MKEFYMIFAAILIIFYPSRAVKLFGRSENSEEAYAEKKYLEYLKKREKNADLLQQDDSDPSSDDSDFPSTTPSMSPRILRNIPNNTVAVGREVKMSCIAENVGIYQVAWVHVDRQMIVTVNRHVITRLPRYYVNFDGQNTWTLTILNARIADNGWYMCQLSSTPSVNRVTYLEVVVPPHIMDDQSTSSWVAVREGTNLTLTCVATGHPDPKIVWRKEDGSTIVVDRSKNVIVPEFPGKDLNMPRINRLDMGVYLCLARNGVPPSVSKRLNVDVEFPPTNILPNQLVAAPYGTNVSLDCVIEAHPKAIAYWTHNDQMIIPTKKYDPKIVHISFKVFMKLTIRGLESADYGRFGCVSKNPLGETEGTIRLYELDLPVEVAPKKEPEPATTTTKPSAGKGAPDHKKGFAVAVTIVALVVVKMLI